MILMADILGGKSGGEEREKFDVVKEELGLDDGMIRELSKSIQYRVLRSLFGDEVDNKVAYLIAEREKKDKAYIKAVFTASKLDYIREPLIKPINDFCGEDLGKLMVFCELLDGKGLEERFEGRYNSGWGGDQAVRELLRVGELGADVEWLKVWADVTRGRSDRAVDELLKFKSEYEGDFKKFKVWAEVGKNSRYGYMEFARLKHLFGDDLEQMKQVAKIVIDFSKGKNLDYAWEILFRLQNGCGEDLEKLGQIASFIRYISDCRFADTIFKEWSGLEGLYGEDFEKLREIMRIISGVEAGENNSGESLAVLITLHESFGNDLKRFKILAEVAKVQKTGVKEFSICCSALEQVLYDEKSDGLQLLSERFGVAKENITTEKIQEAILLVEWNELVLKQKYQDVLNVQEDEKDEEKMKGFVEYVEKKDCLKVELRKVISKDLLKAIKEYFEENPDVRQEFIWSI